MTVETKKSIRKYTTEGAVHLYSSQPSVLTPADLYTVRDNVSAQHALAQCNIYVVATRQRILIDPWDFSVDGSVMSGHFVVQSPTGVTAHVPFDYALPVAEFTDLSVALSGTHLAISTRQGNIIQASHIVVAGAHAEFPMEARDLCVLYVGQGIGRTQKRTALDRLTRHSTLQRILAETQTFHPDHEILLLLYRFEHGNVFASNGGDMTVDASATHEEDLQHLSQLSNVHLGRGSIVSLAEAGLIRYFQPQYNVQLKSADFTAKKKITVLTKVLNQGITGLIVEIGSGNLNSRLFTPSAPPFNMETLLSPEALRGDRLETNELKQQWAEEIHAMAHTHIAKFPLTSPDERDTFLHGTKWVGEEERTPI